MLGYQKSTAAPTPLFTLVKLCLSKSHNDNLRQSQSPLHARTGPRPRIPTNPKHPGTTAEALGREVDFWYSSMRLPGPGPRRGEQADPVESALPRYPATSDPSKAQRRKKATPKGGLVRATFAQRIKPGRRAASERTHAKPQCRFLQPGGTSPANRRPVAHERPMC